MKKDKQLPKKEHKSLDKIDRIDIEVQQSDFFDLIYNKDINIEEGIQNESMCRSGACRYFRAYRFSYQFHLARRVQQIAKLAAESCFFA